MIENEEYDEEIDGIKSSEDSDDSEYEMFSDEEGKELVERANRAPNVWASSSSSSEEEEEEEEYETGLAAMAQDD
eukprot:CAMPEP_0116880888 /NCGR_PEP_ID=MMETSP0463-20121206/12915_1 /TAXON_ID=181622 /ORGANISM="Strombidinopsis sp, Strain SopsisLIS2011" /LENGTH=74 /DNA_ID=CAMNT_0004532113 /DNA_START=1429 /DNA_END=1653 /DNA_ORIENTATION=+